MFIGIVNLIVKKMFTIESKLTESLYRVIHKSLRDFRPLRYSSRDGHAKGEHVNRGRDTPSFCPTLQMLDMSTLGDAADVKFGNFGKFQDTRFLIPCPRHVSSRLHHLRVLQLSTVPPTDEVTIAYFRPSAHCLVRLRTRACMLW
jgi:hypothetical protein